MTEFWLCYLVADSLLMSQLFYVSRSCLLFIMSNAAWHFLAPYLLLQLQMLMLEEKKCPDNHWHFHGITSDGCKLLQVTFMYVSPIYLNASKTLTGTNQTNHRNIKQFSIYLFSFYHFVVYTTAEVLTFTSHELIYYV